MLAKDIKRSQSFIGDIESGRSYPSFKILSDIAKACGVTLDFFDDNVSVNKDVEKFITLQLGDVPEKDLIEMRESLKNDPEVKMCFIYEYLNQYEHTEKSDLPFKNLFVSLEEMIMFMLKHPLTSKYCGFDLNKMNRAEKTKCTEDIMRLIKMACLQYKK